MYCSLATSGRHNKNSFYVPATSMHLLTTGSLNVLISELGITMWPPKPLGRVNDMSPKSQKILEHKTITKQMLVAFPFCCTSSFPQSLANNQCKLYTYIQIYIQLCWKDIQCSEQDSVYWSDDGVQVSMKPAKRQERSIILCYVNHILGFSFILASLNSYFQ